MDYVCALTGHRIPVHQFQLHTPGAATSVHELRRADLDGFSLNDHELRSWMPKAVELASSPPELRLAKQDFTALTRPSGHTFDHHDMECRMLDATGLWTVSAVHTRTGLSPEGMTCAVPVEEIVLDASLRLCLLLECTIFVFFPPSLFRYVCQAPWFLVVSGKRSSDHTVPGMIHL